MMNQQLSQTEITQEEYAFSVCEQEPLRPERIREFDIVVVGAGAAGVPAAGWAAELGARTALLQKEQNVVSQGNCGSAIIRSRSTEGGIARWIHHTNSLCGWRADVKQLRAYAEYSEAAMIWFLNHAGLTSETEYGDGSRVDSNTESAKLLNDGGQLCAFRSTSGDFTGLWRDRGSTYDYGDEHCYFWAPSRAKPCCNRLRGTISSVRRAVIRISASLPSICIRLCSCRSGVHASISVYLRVCPASESMNLRRHLVRTAIRLRDCTVPAILADRFSAVAIIRSTRQGFRSADAIHSA